MPPVLSPTPPPAPPLVVACLCAAWCGVCRDYRAAFEAVATRRANGARFVWIDVEDEADRLGALEVETFPTLVIVRGAVPLFAGPVVPGGAVLERLVAEAAAGRLAPPGAVDDGLGAFAALLGTPE